MIQNNQKISEGDTKTTKNSERWYKNNQKTPKGDSKTTKKKILKVIQKQP